MVPGPTLTLEKLAKFAMLKEDGALMVSVVAPLMVDMPAVSVTLMVKLVTAEEPADITCGTKDSASRADVTASAVPLTV